MIRTVFICDGCKKEWEDRPVRTLKLEHNPFKQIRVQMTDWRQGECNLFGGHLCEPCYWLVKSAMTDVLEDLRVARREEAQGD